jgi:hypothetical protein
MQHMIINVCVCVGGGGVQKQSRYAARTIRKASKITWKILTCTVKLVVYFLGCGIVEVMEVQSAVLVNAAVAEVGDW